MAVLGGWAVSYERGTPVISSGRVFTINTRAQQKLLHTCIILVIVKHHLVQIGRIDGPTEYFLRILVYLVIYDSGKVSLEHLLLSRHPSQIVNTRRD